MITALSLLPLVSLVVFLSSSSSACPNSENPIGTGNISSPNYPNSYDNNAYCIYLLVADQMNVTNASSSAYIVLQLIEFTTEYNYDFLNIFDGPSINSPLIIRLSGPLQPGLTVNSTQRYMSLSFVTDATIVYRGFFATYTSVMGNYRCPFRVILLSAPPVSGCPNGGGYPVGSGELTSPGYPRNYSNNEDCLYIVSADINRTLSIQIQFFQTERNHDYLYIYDGQSITSPIIAVLTGRYEILPNYFTTGQFLTLRFVTDAAIVDAGFRIIYQNSFLGTTPGITDNSTQSSVNVAKKTENIRK